MISRNRNQIRTVGRIVTLAVFMLIMSACTMGATANPDPVIIPSVTPLPVGPGVVFPTNTPAQQIVATNTPVPELLPAEKLGPIVITGTDHRTTEPITVKVTKGKSVSTVTCSWVLQDSGRTGTLGTPTETPVDDNTSTLTFTLTPDAAGTYVVNCTGIATTVSGQRAVSANGTPFAVEAKG